jgi:hypothetical protein
VPSSSEPRGSSSVEKDPEKENEGKNQQIKGENRGNGEGI